MTDVELERKILDLQLTIETWAVEKGLWTDSGFSSYEEYFDDEPSEVTATVTVLWTEGGLFSMFNGFSYGEDLDEFDKLIETSGFYYEQHASYAIEFFAADEELNQAYLNYFEWRWIANLIKPDYTSLYEEVFRYFRNSPQKLYALTPRKFEILISEIFRNQGYRTILGKGQGDEGVDVRIYRKDDIDQVPILVQVKKYRDDRPIDLQAVAALTGCVVTEKAKQGIFITTSRYLPGAKRFAKRENSQIILKDSSDVQQWCSTAGKLIVRDRSLLTSNEHLLTLIAAPPMEGLTGRVVVASWGHDMILNDFCIIVKDTPEVVLLMKIPSSPIYEDTPYNMMGRELPLLNEEIIKFRIKENFYRAKKSVNEKGEITFFTKSRAFSLWDGSPQIFNYID